MADMKQFQENGRHRLLKIFESNSRAFLADEAGLGKTFTSAGVIVKLAENQWAKQEEEKQEITPFYALYVGPNQALLEKCCNDIVDKTDGQVEYVKKNWHSLVIQKIQYLFDQNKWEKFDENKKEKEKKLYTEKFFSKYNVYEQVRRNEKGIKSVFRRFHKEVYDEKYMVVFATYWKNSNKPKINQGDEKEYDRLTSFDFAHKGRKIILYSTSIGVMGVSRDIPDWELRFSPEGKTCLEFQKEQLENFGIVLFDEYHRYFTKLNVNASHVRDVELASDLKVLYISATPYQANKGDMLAEDGSAEDGECLDTLPTLKAFETLFNAGITSCTCNLMQLDTEYKQAIKAKEDPGKELEDALKTRMVRHERTLLSANQNPEEHKLLFSDKRPEDYTTQLFNMRKQIQGLQVKGFSEGAVNWSKNMPWLMSFSTKYKTYDPFVCLKSDTELPKELFLNDDDDDFSDKVQDLPNQNIAFKQIIDANIAEEMSQLIWLPPTNPINEPPEYSIFSKYKDYSKLLVFGEYKYIQRGGALLLSQYADLQNSIDVTSFDFELPQDSTRTIATTLKLDPGKLNEVFESYFNRPQIKCALLSWMKGKKGTHEELLARYCTEGNLLAVMKEWKENAGEKFTVEYIKEILNRQFSTVHIQTHNTYKEKQDGVEYSCGFAERLTFDVNDVGSASGAKVEKEHKQIQDSFNSPFYPFILFAGKGAQEGFDFHKYCLRIMHMTLPRGAVSFDQRQGRIDRYGSLLVRRRAIEVCKNNDLDYKNKTFSDIFKKLNESPKILANDSWRNDELFPEWQIKENDYYVSKHHFERIVPAIPYTHEDIEYKEQLNYLNSYRSTIGSCGENVKKEYIINLTAPESEKSHLMDKCFRKMKID